MGILYLFFEWDEDWKMVGVQGFKCLPSEIG